MPHYTVLRVHREDNPANKSECQVKFFPIKTRLKSGACIPLVFYADTELEAYGKAVVRFPAFRCYLAVQESGEYDRIIGNLVAKRTAKPKQPPRIEPEGIFRIPVPAVFVPPIPSPVGANIPLANPGVNAGSFFGIG